MYELPPRKKGKHRLHDLSRPTALTVSVAHASACCGELQFAVWT
jgi:hypothetical protein